jgi:hypothetical protein
VSVYKGVLEEMGSGNEIPRGTGVWTTRVTYGGYGSAVTKEGKNALGGWTRHDFIPQPRGDVLIKIVPFEHRIRDSCDRGERRSERVRRMSLGVRHAAYSDATSVAWRQ